ncbi:MAG: long-chain-fatty-acid--CoA ligase [Alphaproteobacteria bacterium]
MQGLMQDWPLLCHTMIDHAAEHHGTTEIVTRTVEGPIHRETYADAHARARKLAQALEKRGVKLGDRIGTVAWNTHRHFEAWYGMMGLGAIYHTINPRLFPEQIAYIIDHAEDSWIFVDLSFLGTLEKIADKLASVRGYVILTDAAHMPKTTLKNAIPYEDLIAGNDGDFAWKQFDENTAAGLCYTSGTTGNPKGVLYSHRSNVLHALAVNTADAVGMRAVDTMMPIVPMFHANAWSIAFGAPAAGAKLVMPGARMDGESICELLTNERVTVTAAVPTVWLAFLEHLRKTGQKPEHLERVVIGGAACPRAMMEAFERDYGIKVFHAWGMTEMSPVGTIGSLKAREAKLPFAGQIAAKLKQGRALYTVEMKITDDSGKEMPRDGKTFGRLKVKGPAVVKRYFKNDGGEVLDEEGFFDTGDVATICPEGYMQITDRSKDVIKSGGEWISSIEIENMAIGHPDVAEAAVIGVKHPKWDERPLLVVVPKEGARPTRESILKYFEGKIAKWWMPDDVVFVTAIPHTATGKIQKRELRETFRDHKLPTA